MASYLNLNRVSMGQEKTTDKKQWSLMVKILTIVSFSVIILIIHVLS